MSQPTINALAPVGNLFLTVESTETSKVLADALTLFTRCPEIGRRIAADQDRVARRKKKLRLDHGQWQASRTPAFGAMPVGRDEIVADRLSLNQGRHRMVPEAVYVFEVMRGTYGSVTDREAVERLCDSVTLRVYLQNRNLKRPGVTTILENVNAISNETREFILDAQLGMILDERLDDFDKLILDSTAAKANSSWPTDADMMYELANRAFHSMGLLVQFGLPAIRPWYCPRWLKETKSLVFKINTAKGPGNRKKLYRRLLNRVDRLVTYMLDHYNESLVPAKPPVSISPRLRQRLDRLWERITEDLSNTCRVAEYARARVLHGKSTPSTEKVLSLSDKDLAFIQKGNREAVLGYKPQLGRSGNGFVSAFRLSAGNTADAPEAVPLVLQSQARTGVVPRDVTTDDGYTSMLNRECLQYLGVEEPVFSGAKGKQITPAHEWDSEFGRQARNGRSAVESLIFTLKFVYAFGRLRRRGLEAVRAEMLGKVIAYNFRRMSQVREMQAGRSAKDRGHRVA
jgi:hypothetical protein